MANLNGFNANEVEPASSFEPLPAGKYLAAITESEMKPTKSGGGQYLQFTFQILEGPHKGRNVWARLNLHNSNPTTVQIAQQELSALCRAVGIMTPRDSAELHNLPLVITVKRKKREDTGEFTNEVKGFESKSAAPAVGRPQQAPVTSNTPPWKR
ncbi:MAG: DUF669 domain-containing protein [Phycisphaerales bacterium]|nr:DUF669 domain-containing protein [Phycisphaerales bacterium]